MSDKQLPKGWQKRKSRDGKYYYRNLITGVDTFTLPTKPAAKYEDLPSGWIYGISHDGRTYYINTVTKKSQWNKPTKPAVNLPIGWVQKKSKTGKVYYFNANLNKSQWTIPTVDTKVDRNISTSCTNLRGLSWTGNSCYLDSALFSFFAVPTRFADQLINMDLVMNPILDPRFGGNNWPCGITKEEDLANRQLVQEQLRHIANSIRGTGPFVKYCSKLRQTLKACSDPENYHGEGFADSGEFMTYILNMFPLNIAQKKVVTYATNYLGVGEIPSHELVKTSESWDYNANVIHFVPMSILEQADDGVNISKFLRQTEDSGELTSENMFEPDGFGGIKYKRRIAIETLEYTPYLIFNIKRVGVQILQPDKKNGKVRVHEVFIRKRINPEPIVTLSNGQKFELSAVVIYIGRPHYVSIVKCNGVWYYYNDNPSGDNYELRKIGNYEDVVRKAPYNPNTNGTQYYYTPVGVVSDPPVHY